MPNWCDCTYKCVGDLKEVKSLYKILKYIDRRKTSIEKNGFGKWWLGNLVTKLGGNWEKYRCRGEITYYELNNNILTICQSTAWYEQEGVRNIIEEKFPSIEELKAYFDKEEKRFISSLKWAVNQDSIWQSNYEKKQYEESKKTLILLVWILGVLGSALLVVWLIDKNKK